MAKTEFEQMRDKALEQLMKGQYLTDKDGVFAPLLQQFSESAPESEMNVTLLHLFGGRNRQIYYFN